MPNIFRPMLAATAEQLQDVKLPTWGSAKLDGIRCHLITSPRTGKRLAASRSLKPIANIWTRKVIELSALPIGVEGELIVGDNFQETTSAIMSVGGKPDFHFHIFDYVGADMQLSPCHRLAELSRETQLPRWASFVKQTFITSEVQLAQFIEQELANGHEGCMFKYDKACYHMGRASLLKQQLVKYKPYTDSTATVVGFTELHHNDNEQTTSALGYAERSDDFDNQVPGDTLGALVCRDPKFELTFKVGTGFSAGQRKAIWNQRENFKGKKFDYKYQPFGVKDKPRSPVFLKWRHDL